MTERLMMFIIHTQPNWLLNLGRHLATCLVSGVHFSPSVLQIPSRDVQPCSASGSHYRAKLWDLNKVSNKVIKLVTFGFSLNPKSLDHWLHQSLSQIPSTLDHPISVMFTPDSYQLYSLFKIFQYGKMQVVAAFCYQLFYDPTELKKCMAHQ